MDSVGATGLVADHCVVVAAMTVPRLPYAGAERVNPRVDNAVGWRVTDFIDAERKRQGLGVYALSRAAGYTDAYMSSMIARGHPLTIEGAEAHLNVLGYTLAVVKKRPR